MVTTKFPEIVSVTSQVQSELNSRLCQCSDGIQASLNGAKWNLEEFGRRCI